MGGPVARTLAAVFTLGTSELGQEKPFQDVTEEDRPIGGASGSGARFITGWPLLYDVIMGPEPEEPKPPATLGPLDVGKETNKEILEKVAPKTVESIKDLQPESIKRARARVLRTSQRGVQEPATVARPALGSTPSQLGGKLSYLGR